MTARFSDWEQRLADCLAEWQGVAFAWHDADCCRFVCAVVQAQTGDDFFAPYLNKYDTRAGSAAALREIGKGTIRRTFDELLPVKPVAFAQRGDLVFANRNIGVCIGETALFVGQEGEGERLVSVGRDQWTRCWAVG